MERHDMQGLNAPVQAELPPRRPDDSDDPKAGYDQIVPPLPKPKENPGS
jgi:hypothetical protein